MKPTDADLERLLRSAGQNAVEDEIPQMPFGFETRVVALSRENGARPNGAGDLTRFVRRITATAVAILAVASAGAYQQFNAAEESELDDTPLAEAYAIADAAIQTELSP